MLPWVSSVSYLGIMITDVLDSMSQDILEKLAQYISKNNELTQNFYYADPATISKLNHAFNTHFNGSPVWDMFSTKFRKVEKAWNTSNRIMFSLPRATQRYLIELISDRSNIIFPYGNV